MSEWRQRSVAGLHGLLARVTHALDVLPDGVATALGVALGLGVALAAVRGNWLWLGLAAAGVAFALGRSVGARPRREGLLVPAMGSVMLAGVAAGLMAIGWSTGEGDELPPLVLADEEGFLRLDLGGGETGGGSSTGGDSTGDGSSDSGGTSEGSGSTGDTGSTSTGSGQVPPKPPPRPRRPRRTAEVEEPDISAGTSTSGGSTTGDDEAGEGDRTLKICRSGVFIEGGSFDGHTVKDLCMDETEVTVAQYQRCVDKGTCTAADAETWCNTKEGGRGRHPINCVDWNQAKTFCEKFAGKRLPTQWEWEWAARGRDAGWTYPWGNAPEPSCERVVMNGEGDWGCGKKRTWPVGSKPKGNSRDGLKDMAGNVWEWTSSKSGGERIVRGGSWDLGFPSDFRASRRFSFVPSVRVIFVGFRCARTSGGSE